MSEANKPAFPGEHYFADRSWAGQPIKTFQGLTKREYFAAMSDIPWNAVIDTLELNGHVKPTMQDVLAYRAKLRLREADCILAELSKPSKAAEAGKEER